MKGLSLLAVAALLALSLVGCSKGEDDSNVAGLPVNKPAATADQQAAQASVANDPKAAGDAPRPDGK